MMIDPSIWPGNEIPHLQSYQSHVLEYSARAGTRRRMLFRGQSREWPLSTTLQRVLPPATAALQAVAAEKLALDHFESQAHLHSPEFGPLTANRSLLEQWAWMQHHQAPTRLLDWTTSPYVALYFASEANHDADGVVFMIDATAADDYWTPRTQPWSFTSLPSDQNQMLPRLLRLFSMQRPTTRVVAQQGVFTASNDPTAPQEDLLREAGAIVRRFVIPGNIKIQCLSALREMNIGPNTLFPGLDGLGRSTTALVRLSLAHDAGQ